jgi:hypothetical protein
MAMNTVMPRVWALLNFVWSQFAADPETVGSPIVPVSSRS